MYRKQKEDEEQRDAAESEKEPDNTGDTMQHDEHKDEEQIVNDTSEDVVEEKRMEEQRKNERGQWKRSVKALKRMEEEHTEPVEDVRDPEEREEERSETQQAEEPTQLIDDALEMQEADNEADNVGINWSCILLHVDLDDIVYNVCCSCLWNDRRIRRHSLASCLL